MNKRTNKDLIKFTHNKKSNKSTKVRPIYESLFYNKSQLVKLIDDNQCEKTLHALQNVTQSIKIVANWN